MDISQSRRVVRRLRRLWSLRVLNKLYVDAAGTKERLDRLRPALLSVLRANADPQRLQAALRRAEAVSAALDPVHLAPVRDLSSMFGLSADEARVIALAAVVQSDDLLVELGEMDYRYRPQSPLSTVHFVSDALGLERRRVQRVMTQRSVLARSGLLRVDATRYSSTVPERLELADGLVDFLALRRTDLDGVLGRYFRRTEPAKLRIEDYPHLQSPIERMREYLKCSAKRREPGANVLLYGPPGTGKSQLALAVAAAAGLDAYLVRTADDDGDPIDGYDRLRAFELAQRALRDRRDALLVFDEVEDVFRSADRNALNRSVSFKGWLNERLERNPVPTLWICNDVDSLEPSQRRRFDLVLEVPIPSRRARRALIDRYLGEHVADEGTRAAWAEHPAVSPALLARAARVIDRVSPASAASAEQLARQSIDEVLRLEREKPLPQSRMSSAFEIDLVNPDVKLQPVVQLVCRMGSARICLYGPPGTGKSAFSRYLAEQLDRSLLMKRASDLQSPYIGVTERNIAAAFEEAEREGAVLVMDEVDSFLLQRQAGQRAWEISQVNELLTQLESFNGVFVASSNLLDIIDPAALRRFDFKIRFDYLRLPQRVALFNHYRQQRRLRHCIDDAEVPARLQSMTLLTPGDFAAIDRRLQAVGDTATDLDLLDFLASEIRMKPEGRVRSIGFATQ